MMTKYKVGDQVNVAKDCFEPEEYLTGPGWNKNMSMMVNDGKIYTIETLRNYITEQGRQYYGIRDTTGMAWVFPEEALEKVQEPKPKKCPPEIRVLYEVDGEIFKTEADATSHVMKIMLFDEICSNVKLDGHQADLIHHHINRLVDEKRIAIRMKKEDE